MLSKFYSSICSIGVLKERVDVQENTFKQRFDLGHHIRIDTERSILTGFINAKETRK